VLQLVAGNEIVGHAFAGISVAVCALIVQAILKLVKTGIKDLFTVLIAVLSFGALSIFDASPIIIIIGAAVLGVVAKYFIDKSNAKKEVKQ
jgi:chromate transporter